MDALPSSMEAEMEDAVAYRLVDSPTPTVRSWDATDDAPRPMDGRLATAAYALLSFGAGALQVVNVGFNAEVAAVVASPIVASALTPPIALASLLAVDPCAGSAKRPTWRAGFRETPLKVQYLGGALGAAAVLCQTTAAAPLGAVRMHTVMVATELAATLALDHAAPLGRARHAISPVRALGAAVAAGGVVLSAVGSEATGKAAGPALAAYLAVAGLNGVFLPVQVTLNTSLAQPFGSPARPAILSMASASLVLAAAVAVLFAADPGARTAAAAGLPDVDAYLYSSGVLAAIWVGISVVACKRLSLASFFILNTLGRCAASVAVDATGALGFPKLGVDAFAVSGLALACVGAAILQRGSPATGPAPPTKTGLELTAAPLAGDTLAVDAALA